MLTYAECDSDWETGHARLQVCPVDNTLIACCSGLSVELWVTLLCPATRVPRRQAGARGADGVEMLSLDEDKQEEEEEEEQDQEEEEEEMDYSGYPPHVVAMLKGTQRTSAAGGGDSDSANRKSQWQLLAELREHRDDVRALAWRLDGRILASADTAGHVKFWARGADQVLSLLALLVPKYKY